MLASSGEGGIRTLGTRLEYGSLANYWFKPLTHLSDASAKIVILHEYATFF